MIEIGDSSGVYRERAAEERRAAARATTAELQRTHLQLAEHYERRARELELGMNSSSRSARG
ncbi:hypothetical protein [Sphingomonas crocodyli]|uniref:Uncharacterized protein n=1 Tax=Sphingomonas crocodyli TaxID=1979270 RepID=A0A437LWS3_9SPHN|nr:hypothetical protein [Sphingomonas crocodyli]RVT89844.1 hypothetical protein EOD43_20950 [Sphingomonas crocodyli]